MRYINLIFLSLLVGFAPIPFSNFQKKSLSFDHVVAISDIGTTDTRLTGGSVSINNGYAFIGALGDNTTEAKMGSVDIYKKTGATWDFLTKIANPYAVFDRNQYWGNVASSEDARFLAVGPDDKGNLNIYERTGDTFTKRQDILLPGHTITTAGKRYAPALSSDGTYLVVGDYYHSTYNGRVVVYYRQSANSTFDTTPIATFTNPVSGNYFYFGRKVSISPDGNFIITSATDNTVSSFTRAGSVYIYKRATATTYNTTPVFTYSGTAQNSLSGSCISINNNSAIFSYDVDTGKMGQLRLYNYNGTSWVLSTTLEHPNKYASDFFGGDCKIRNVDNYILVRSRDVTAGENGAVFFFYKVGSSYTYKKYVRSSWPIANTQANYGWDLDMSLDGKDLLLGARWADTQASQFDNGLADILVSP